MTMATGPTTLEQRLRDEIARLTKQRDDLVAALEESNAMLRCAAGTHLNEEGAIDYLCKENDLLIASVEEGK